MKAPYSLTRMNKIVVAYKPAEREESFEDQKKTRVRIDRTGVLSVNQYRLIWDSEYPAAGRCVGMMAAVAIHSKLDRSKNWKGVRNLE